jgi:hypothetical protein
MHITHTGNGVKEDAKGHLEECFRVEFDLSCIFSEAIDTLLIAIGLSA